MISVNYQALAKLLVESAKALGKTLSDPNVQKTIITAAGASLVTGVSINQIDKQKYNALLTERDEKLILYKEAIVNHDAIIKELRSEAITTKERMDYLEDLNNRLQSQINLCKEEDANESI